MINSGLDLIVAQSLTLFSKSVINFVYDENVRERSRSRSI